MRQSGTTSFEKRSGQTPSIDELIEALCALPVSSTAALQVMRLLDDPDVDSTRIASVMETDPIMTARLLRMANSSYFGLSRRVSSARNAVMVVGFSTVRSIAALTAGGVAGSRAVPRDFWVHSALTAAASSAFAKLLGFRGHDAFSVGLLHDLGEALLYQCDRDAARRAKESDDQLAAEAAEFGITHPVAARLVLEAWQFPTEFLNAVERHHEPIATPGPLAKCLLMGIALVEGDDDYLATQGVSAEEAAEIRSRIEQEAQVLTAGLS